VQLHRDLELAELLDGLVELDLAAVDGEVLAASASAMSLDVTEPNNWSVRRPSARWSR
jgi:hypothetical protein